MSSLLHYGLDQHWLDEFEKLSQDAVLARVVRVDRGGFDAVTDDGIARCTGGAICTGDWVALDGESFRLIAILPRRTAIERASAGTTSDTQVLGANVDTVVVTVASDTALDLGRVERYITLAWGSGAVPVLAITKTDSGSVAEELLLAAAPGVTVCSTSAVSDGGIDSLAAHLRGTVALIGPSGSGKSTLGNACWVVRFSPPVLPARATAKAGTRRCIGNWCRFLPRAWCCWTPRVCVRWASRDRKTLWRALSPTSINSPRRVDSAIARTNTNPDVRSLPPSTRVSSPREGWATTENCCGRTPGPPRGTTPEHAARSFASTSRSRSRYARNTPSTERGGKSALVEQ
nr:GTPase RsgA [Rhodococcus sp. BS-15]